MARWQKGESGNPAGRTPGRPDSRRLVFEQLVPYAGELVSKAVALALEGDQQMLSLCLNKIIPSPKPVDGTVHIEGFSGSLKERGERIVEAVAAGQLSPDEGAALLGPLQTLAKLAEVDELTKRVEDLERAAGQN